VVPSREAVACAGGSQGGAPIARGIRTEALAELGSDGVSVAALAEDYGLPEGELRQALAYEWDTSHRQAA
jgi:uncharacterized protein (DUF433 family)